MTKIFRSREKPFQLDESKLRRIVSLTDSTFENYDIKLRHRFKVNTRGSRHYSFGDVEEVLSLDNSRKERIKDIYIHFTDERSAEDDTVNRIEVHFHGDATPRTCLDVRNNNVRLANEINSILDEQVERTFQDGVMQRIAYQKWTIGLVAVIALIAVWLLLTILSTPSTGFNFDNNAINAIQSVLSNQTMPDENKAQQIVLVIAEYIVEVEQSQGIRFWQRATSDWTFSFVIIPPLIIVIAFIYMLYFCYPNAVYLWGDGQERYESLEGRRKAIWTMVIASILIGVIANLFVLGLDRFIT
jgi:hypothetical protein